MNLKQLKARRRERLAALTARDRANRCPICLRALDGASIVDWLSNRRYCSDACLEDAHEREDAKP